MMAQFAAFWGLGGVVLLLASAVFRLTPLAIQAFSDKYEWSLYHWVTLVMLTLFMAYVEGYRAFQLGFSPRVAARARYLRGHRSLLHTVLAPLFCMAFYHAPKKRQITSISVTAGIIVLVVLVRFIPQPWRGIIDGSVVVGLTWGLVSLVIFGYQAITEERFDHSPEVSEENNKA